MRSAMMVLGVMMLVGGTHAARSTPEEMVPGERSTMTTPTSNPSAGLSAQDKRASMMRGRQLVISHGCGGCHGGGANPNHDGFLVGVRSPDMEWHIGPCFVDTNLKPCWLTRPRNLTPDNTTGTGRFSERQLFNALRYGLRPGETPDVTITGITPGAGNFPANPKYLAPPMPWTEFRHMTDQELWDIAAYLKNGLRPMRNQVADSEGPPDFWASEYTVAKIGTYPASAFPTARERAQ